VRVVVKGKMVDKEGERLGFRILKLLRRRELNRKARFGGVVRSTHAFDGKTNTQLAVVERSFNSEQTVQILDRLMDR